MKNSEILARAVADVAGLPLGTIRASLAVIVGGLSPVHRFNEERPKDEAERLLAALRLEMEKIRQSGGHTRKRTGKGRRAWAGRSPRR